jgi:uncharacterized protein YkwD
MRRIAGTLCGMALLMAGWLPADELESTLTRPAAVAPPAAEVPSTLGEKSSSDQPSDSPEPTAVSADAPSDPAAVEPETVPPTIADSIRLRTNVARAEQMLPELAASLPLQVAAQSLADHMAKTGAFSHTADGRTPAQRVEEQDYQWRFVAENIAYRSDTGATVEGTAELLLEQWLTSPGHRANILSREPLEMGVATAESATGEFYAVQVFAAPLLPLDP